MSLSRIRLGWAIAVVVVLAAALVPVAGARTHGVQPTSPWYAYDAALRQAQHQHHQLSVAYRTPGVQPTSPWYAYDAALRKAQHQRHQKSVGYRFFTDTLGGGRGANKAQ